MLIRMGPSIVWCYAAAVKVLYIKNIGEKYERTAIKYS